MELKPEPPKTDRYTLQYAQVHIELAKRQWESIGKIKDEEAKKNKSISRIVNKKRWGHL